MDDDRIVGVDDRKQQSKSWDRLYQAEFEQRKKFESVANQTRDGLSSLLVKAIEEFNARVPPYHEILAHTPSHVVLMAEKNSFPAGLLIVRMKERTLVCSYSYSRNPEDMPQSRNQTYIMQVGENGIQLLTEDRSIPKNEIAREILGPFFEQSI